GLHQGTARPARRRRQDLSVAAHARGEGSGARPHAFLRAVRLDQAVAAHAERTAGPRAPAIAGRAQETGWAVRMHPVRVLFDLVSELLVESRSLSRPRGAAAGVPLDHRFARRRHGRAPGRSGRSVSAIPLPHHHELHQHLPEGPESRAGDRRDQAVDGQAGGVMIGWYLSLPRIETGKRLTAGMLAGILLLLGVPGYLPLIREDPLWIFRSLFILLLITAFGYLFVFISGRSPRWFVRDSPTRFVWTRKQLRALQSQREAQLKRLRWRCRRGTRELDALLGGWLDAQSPRADDALAAFDEFLSQPDPLIWDWLMGNASPPRADWQEIVDAIRTRNRI